MRYAAVTDRLARLGGAKWAVHYRAQELRAQGRDVIALTIGEPDLPPPPELLAAASDALEAGRTGYSSGRGEPALREALARRYSARPGRRIGPDQTLAFPGTQTALYGVLTALAGPGDEVLAGDPMYATYEGLVAATGASLVPVPLRAEAGFRLRVEDLAPRLTPRARVLLLNSPHNPTGAVLGAGEIAALGRLAVERDLWIVADEVYEELVFEGVAFASPLDDPSLAERTVVASSISKSHAAPGFRSGWAIGPAAFVDRALPVAETMLFGTQPFLADATAAVLARPSPVAAVMRRRFAARAALVHDALDGRAGLRVHRPSAGMFALLDVAATGRDGTAFAHDLLEATGVAAMPGASFGAGIPTCLRLALTVPDAVLAEACRRIAAHAGARRPAWA